MTRRIALPTIALAALLAACGPEADSATVSVTLDSAAIAALPELMAEPGTLLCTATGHDGCPLHNAVANRLADGSIAIWEPGMTIHRFVPGDSVSRPLGQAGAGGSYVNAMAIASTGTNRYRVVTYDGEWRVLTFDGAGNVQRTELIADPGMLNAVGFVGSQPVRQGMSGWGTDTAGHLTVTLLDRITDTSGTVILDTPVRWLRGGTEETGPIPPLLASTPVWTLTADGDLVWSPGDRLVVERRTRDGRVKWRLDGPAGRAITGGELDAREAVVRGEARHLPFTDEDYAEMRRRSDSLRAAVVGLTSTPDGRVILSQGPSADGRGIDFLRLAADGTPEARFRLDPRVKVLVAEGDSLLVHTPTEGEPWEVRWMRLKREVKGET